MTTAKSLGPCFCCGDPAVDFHHLSGRDLDHARLDKELGVPLCHNCHEDAHDDLRAAGIDTPPSTTATPLGTVEHCLARVASFLGRLCEFWTHPFWQTIASTVQGWAELLGHQRTLLDLHCPGWQQHR
ncbi:MAG: hypothetical protein JWM89_3433 [Acidimicrobiales bacterium]|nr:hypothetical protein [Acidimicrobiales bacterium]